jgi:ferric iron reductase protein FhuF
MVVRSYGDDGAGRAVVLSGALLQDPQWLGERIDQLGRFYRTAERSTLATLWWYSASVVVLAPALHALVTRGRGVSVRSDELLITLTPYGYLGRVLPAPGAGVPEAGAAALGTDLDVALTPIICALAVAGQVPPQRLWALAADAVGTCLIAEQSPEVARQALAGSARLRPQPRFLSVRTGPSGTGPPLTALRRNSCCMLFRVPGQDLCVACPRQVPAERDARLARYARSLPG